MFLQAAIGDAYGAGFEFADRDFIAQRNTLTQYERNPKYGSLYRRYTDDTQMAIAIAELILEAGPWDERSVAGKFVEVFQRDPREGYAARFYQILTEVRSGAELLERIVAKSERNGAAMRAYPIGVFPTEAEVVEKARIQAAVTHHTEKATLGAEAVALMSHFFLRKKGKMKDLAEYVSDILQYPWRRDWTEWVEVDPIQTVHAVLTVLTKERSLTGMLRSAVALGGDTDTVASLALAIGSLDEDVEQDLPAWLYDDLENGPFGRDFLKDLDHRFSTSFVYL
ncbi:MAG: ADP-ribosylglycohydrolase family protein [Saprospiraceae bacterium]